MTPSRDPGLRWSVEHRQHFIEDRLYWDGRVNRGDLVAAFGISVPQASADLSLYQQVAAGNLRYDTRARTYVAAGDFRPVYGVPDPEGFLDRAAQGAAPGVPADRVPRPARHVDPDAVRRLAAAMRAGQALPVLYQSMTRAAPEWRRIVPGAFAHDGMRWHLRAFCQERRKHRDFVIPRMLRFGPVEPAAKPPPDEDWARMVTIRLRPAMRLEAGPRAAVERDYGMVGGETQFAVRAALLPYAWRRLGLDRADGLTELVNDAEVRSELDRVGWRG